MNVSASKKTALLTVLGLLGPLCVLVAHLIEKGSLQNWLQIQEDSGLLFQSTSQIFYESRHLGKRGQMSGPKGVTLKGHLDEARALAEQIQQSTSTDKVDRVLGTFLNRLSDVSTQIEQFEKASRLLVQEAGGLQKNLQEVRAQTAERTDWSELLDQAEVLASEELFTDLLRSRFQTKFDAVFAQMDSLARAGGSELKPVVALVQSARERSVALLPLAQERHDIWSQLSSLSESTLAPLEDLRSYVAAEIDGLWNTSQIILLGATGVVTVVLLVLFLVIGHSIQKPFQELTRTVETLRAKANLKTVETATRAPLPAVVTSAPTVTVEPFLEHVQRLTQITKRSNLPSLLAAHQMLEQNLDGVGRFMTEDPRGKNLPEFFVSMGKVLEEEQQRLQTELDALDRSLRQTASGSEPGPIA